MKFMKNVDYLIVGAGFSGVTIAERIASVLKKEVIIIDKRGYFGGNSYDYFDSNNILVHKFGPHWFHTNDEFVFSYLSGFTEWIEHKHIIRSSLNGKHYPFPVNRKTLNELYGLNLQTEEDVKQYLESVRLPIEKPKNAEEMVLGLVGEDLYEKFYKNYTIKQWGIHPKELDASVTKRIPIRYSDDESYFNDKFQVMPKSGYTNLIRNMLDNRLIKLELGVDFNKVKDKIKYKVLIFTGPIDEYYKYCFGELGYRSLKFEHLSIKSKFYQECQQVNYPNENDFTRIIEWKHATKSESSATSIMREYPIDYRRGAERFYPVPTERNRIIYRKYAELANKEKNLFFIGRLAEYKYYNMDQVVANALMLFNDKLNYLK